MWQFPVPVSITGIVLFSTTLLIRPAPPLGINTSTYSFNFINLAVTSRSVFSIKITAFSFIFFSFKSKLTLSSSSFNFLRFSQSSWFCSSIFVSISFEVFNFGRRTKYISIKPKTKPKSINTISIDRKIRASLFHLAL